MDTAASELQDAQVWLAKQAPLEIRDCVVLATHLKRFAHLFARTSKEQHRNMISEFHNDAGRLPYFGDKDIGALILESTADEIVDVELRAFLYNEARLRATWCAQAASAGGEGIARSRHIQSLDAKERDARVGLK
jgi:hypothetical protein